MSESKPSTAHSSLWGASWRLEVEGRDPPDFDDADLRALLERHFGPSTTNYQSAADMLRNGVIVKFGATDLVSSQEIEEGLHALKLTCRRVQQSSDPHERFPPFLAPPEAYLSTPLVLRVSGEVDAGNSDIAARLIQPIIYVQMSDVKAALAECERGEPFFFPVSYQVHADGLAQRLTELGYAVTILQVTE